MGEAILYQFRSSHYNEKARWALDYKGLRHRRRTLLPGFHAGVARKLSGASRLPLLELDGEVISDSTRIIAALEERHPEPPLYPRQPAERQRALELEDYFDEELGPHLRLVIFYLMLPHPQFVASLFAGGRSAPLRRAYGLMIATQRRKLAASMGIDRESYEASSKRVEAALARLESEIGPEGYLVGSRFGVADLAAAALFSIGAFPDEHPHPPVLPPPPAVRAYWDSLSGRPGIEWAREMYRKHRGSSAAVSE